MTRITCDESERLRATATGVSAGLTRMGWWEGGPPIIRTTWHRDGVDILLDVRHPAGEAGQPDREPCEHYAIEEDQ